MIRWRCGCSPIRVRSASLTGLVRGRAFAGQVGAGMIPRVEAGGDQGPGRALRLEGELQIGVLVNPRSGTNGQDLKRYVEIADRHKRVTCHQVVTPEDVSAAVHKLAAEPVDVVAVSGGDGTVQAVLTALFHQKPFEILPPLALLAGGTTSMTAADVGLKGNPVRAVERLLAWAEGIGFTARTLRRAVLRVDCGPHRTPLYGTFFNAAGIVQVTRARWDARRRARSALMRGGVGTAVIVGRYLLGLILGHRVVDPTPIGIRLDGEPLGNRDYLALFITTLVRFKFGMRPYWGEGPKPLKLTAIAHEPKHLFLAAPAFFRGKRSRYLQPEFGYLSRNINGAVLQLEGECALDGQILMRDPRDALGVTYGGEVDFLQL